MGEEGSEPPEGADKIDQQPATRARCGWFRSLKAELLRGVVLPGAIAYSAALLVGAMPATVRPQVLDKAHHSANKFIATYLHTVAGLPLFGGSGTSDYRRKGMCWVMVGVLPDGSQKRVYESYPNCKYPAVRVFNRDFDTYLQRLTWLEYRRLQSPRREKRQAVVTRLRRSRALSKVSEYFCESPLEDNSDIESLYIVWRYSSIRYKTGRVYPMDAVVHRYDCRNGRFRQQRTWPEISFGEDNGVILELP